MAGRRGRWGRHLFTGTVFAFGRLTMDWPTRRTPAHQPVWLSAGRPPLVMVTVCTKNRRPILATTEGHALLLRWWRMETAWRVGRYTVMPDHVHLFAAPVEAAGMPLQAWFGRWKNGVTRDWPRTVSRPIFQRDAWDRQLRSGESYAAKWAYVRDNPKRHGLVERSEDWPYQGELYRLEWDS